MPYSSSGWFDDPDDATQLRYFDGVVWTQHTAAKRPAVPPPAPGPGGWAQPEGRRDVGQMGGYNAPVADHEGGRARYAGWWQRALALIVDSVLLGLLATPFVGGRAVSAYETFAALVDDMVASGATTPPAVPDGLASDLLVVALVQLALFLAYEIGLLAWRGTTPGRRLLGISVVSKGGGKASAASVVRRTFVKAIGQFSGLLPSILGLLGGVFQLADYLWPLGDADKQALHDKAADTVVVKGRGVGAESTRPDARRGAHRGGHRPF